MKIKGIVITAMITFTIIALCTIDNKNKEFMDDNFKSENQNDFIKSVITYSEQYEKESPSNKEQSAKKNRKERDGYLASKFSRQDYYIKEWSGVVHDIQNKADGSIAVCINVNNQSKKILLCNATNEVMLKNSFNSLFHDKYSKNVMIKNDAAVFTAA